MRGGLVYVGATSILPALRLKRPPPTRNIAGAATASASNEPIPVQFWIKALNDGIVRQSRLPPDMWGTWTGRNPPQAWIEYRSPQPVTIDGARIRFFADQPAGSGIGIAPPAAWHLKCWANGWKRIAARYGNAATHFEVARFPEVTTNRMRAVFAPSRRGNDIAGVAVEEWEVLAAPSSR